MKFKLHHPLWVHLPAVCILIVYILKMKRSLPLPESSPVHFGFSGEPDRYGSPWEIVWVTIGFSIFFILISVVFDDLWARYEITKRFNWHSLMDEIAVAFMVSIGLCHIDMMQSGVEIFKFPWRLIVLIIVSSCITAIFFEMLRKPCPESCPHNEGNNLELQKSIKDEFKSGKMITYSEAQHMPLVTIPAMIIGIILVTFSLFSADDRVRMILLILSGLMLISISVVFHGMITTVTLEHVTVRLEIVKIRLLKLNAADIVDVEFYRFSPIADFGGWGIRFGKKIKGYYWRGNTGALITMKNGKKYLVGSDNANNLAAVIRGAISASSESF